MYSEVDHLWKRRYINFKTCLKSYWGIVDLQCVQQSESVYNIHISTLLGILFSYRSIQSIFKKDFCEDLGENSKNLFSFPSLKKKEKMQ